MYTVLLLGFYMIFISFGAHASFEEFTNRTAEGVKIKNALSQAYAAANSGDRVNFRQLADQLESQVCVLNKHGYDEALIQVTANHYNGLGSWIARSRNGDEHQLNLRTQAVKYLLVDYYKYKLDDLPKKLR